MAKQIRVTITESVYKLLNRTCEEGEASYSDVVNNALLEFLNPKQEETTKLDLVLQYSAKIAEVQQMLEYLMRAQQCYPEPSAAVVTPPNGEVPIATFEQLYGDKQEDQQQFEPLVQMPVQEDQLPPRVPRPGFFWRLLTKE
jgi:hypothetical protein